MVIGGSSLLKLVSKATYAAVFRDDPGIAVVTAGLKKFCPVTGMSLMGSGPIFAKNQNCRLASSNFATVCSAPILGPRKPSGFHLKSDLR
jgi:hypothetical protein